MASMRNIKRRIKSVGSTQQITKAMNLVAASKLQRNKAKLNETLQFSKETSRVIASIVKSSKGIIHPYLSKRETKNKLIVLITGDRGLCGGYNSNASKLAVSISNDMSNVSFITIGSKGLDYITRRNYSLLKSYTGISEKPTYADATELGSIVLDKYKNFEADEVYLVHTEFISTLSQEARATKILPVDVSKFDSINEDNLSIMEYEPAEEEILDYVIPKYINTVIFSSLIESGVCEQAARMTSMDSATENAYEIIDNLSIVYNRVRQGAITQEITEIVSGANVLS